MSMRRFTRLTNAFSKKLDKHKHAIALYFMYYNFCRVHQTSGHTCYGGCTIKSRLESHWLVALLERKASEAAA
ncbi:MAG: hypothetical protein JWO13_39 [Acidobacteriales bacterium]|nr:hypothetical protein [Terriglobales bacterium]